MSENACCVWDFTVGEKYVEREKLHKVIKDECKKFAYQLEEGESGYVHYQGRISLKQKQRLEGLKKIFKTKEIHWSVTSSENRDNQFYVLKDETRKDGPWKDTDIEIYIPRHVREMTVLRPWQQTIVNSADEYHPRRIDVVLDYVGGLGKSSLAAYLRCKGIGREIPFCNNYKDLLRLVMDMPKEKLYIMDMPRAISKECLNQLWSGLETVKSGYAYDDRYKFKDMDFDRPRIWVFTNILPDFSMLSSDMWKLWKVEGDILVEQERIF